MRWPDQNSCETITNRSHSRNDLLRRLVDHWVDIDGVAARADIDLSTALTSMFCD